MYGKPLYDRDASKKIENLFKTESNLESYKDYSLVQELEKLIHTLQEDFSHCFHPHLKNPSRKTNIYFKHYELPRFKKLSGEAYRIYKLSAQSNLSYHYYENDLGSWEQFDELMKRKFTVCSISNYLTYYFNYGWFFIGEEHKPKSIPEQEQLTFKEVLNLIPRTLVMIELDILAADIYVLKSYIEKKYAKNDLLRQAIGNIVEKIEECKTNFKTSGVFNKEIIKDIDKDLNIISQHRGIHNRETHPIFNKIIDTLRLIMSYLTEFLTFPIKYCLPNTRKNIVNFFSEPKTNSQKVVEHFLEEVDMFMEQVNALNKENFFSEPKINSQKVVEPYLEKVDMFMGQVNAPNIVSFLSEPKTNSQKVAEDFLEEKDMFMVQGITPNI